MEREPYSGHPVPVMTRYALSQRLIHWIVAVLVLCALAIGMTLGLLGFDRTLATFGSRVTDLMYITHKTIGVLLLALMLARIALRVSLGRPRYAIQLPRPQKIASGIVHGLLYALLLAMPVLGWLSTATGGFPINFFHWELPALIGRDDARSETLFLWHGILGWALLILIAGHVSAAVYHWRVRRDGVMQRMSLSKTCRAEKKGC
jgi:cytochrome b561